MAGCMSKNRFTDLSQYLRFDDKQTRSYRRSKDKLAPIIEIFDIIMKNLKKSYKPGYNLTIDEQLLPLPYYRITVKPDKFGMEIWWICDSETSYPLFGIPYLGKEGGNRQALNWLKICFPNVLLVLVLYENVKHAFHQVFCRTKIVSLKAIFLDLERT